MMWFQYSPIPLKTQLLTQNTWLSTKLTRIQLTLIKKNMKNHKHESLHSNNYIRLGTKHKGKYILKKNIIYIEAYDSYSWLHLTDGSKLLSCKSIGYHEERLVDNAFIRIHRSYLINLSYLKLYEQKYRLVYLKGETILSVSHRKNRLLSKMMIDHELKMPLRVAV